MNKVFVTAAAAALFLSAHNAVAGDAELVDALLTSTATSCDDLGVERDRVLGVVQALKAEIVSQLQRGERVQLDGIGTFYMERLATTVETGTKHGAPFRGVMRFEPHHNAVSITGEHPRVADAKGNP